MGIIPAHKVFYQEHIAIGVFALYRMTRRAAPAEQGHYVPMDPQSASVAVALAAEEQIEYAEEQLGSS